MPFPFLKRRKSQESEEQAQLKRLAQEVEQLRTENVRLQEQLAAKEVHLGEYLYKWRAVALPLLGSEWELRYWVLDGTTLVYYKSAKDMQFTPREEFSMLGCCLAWEGLCSTRHWAFSLLDGGGSLIMRLSSLSKQSAERWVAALQAAGCVRDDALAPPGGPKGSRGSAKADLERCMSAPPPPVPSPLGGPSPVKQRRSKDGTTSRVASAATLQQPTAGGQGKQQQPAGAGAKGAGPKGAAAKRLEPAGSHSDEPSTPTAPSSFAAAAAPPPASNNPAEGDDTDADAPPPPPLPTRKSLGGVPGAGGGYHGSPAVRGPMLGSTPVHTACRYSLLSSERAWHEKHTGLYNLALIIIVVTNFRLALENALKYGWRLNPIVELGGLMAGSSAGSINVYLVACYPIMMANALISLGLEALGAAMLQEEDRLRVQLSKKRGLDDKEVMRAVRARVLTHEWLLFLMALANTTAVIGLPWTVISLTKAEPISGGLLIMLAMVAWMKLVSYHHCCWDLRMARRAGEVRPGERGCPDTPSEWGPLLKYPENLSVANLAYFLVAPTLVYQVNYPRSRSIRTRWLMRRLFEMAITLTAMAIFAKQYIEPAVQNSLVPLRQMDFPRIVERVLKLALPNMYAWLAGFYCLFHLWLNVLAELTRFGDREFYKDWWNAATVGEYWKTWNMPVHKWLLRHVYFPAIRYGASRFWSMMLVFFVSAVFHELIMGVPLHLLRLWAFFGIMGQVPLIMLTEALRKKLRRDELGNIAFWVSFCVVGQPLSMLMYYHDYVIGIRPAMLAARQLAAAAAAAGGAGNATAAGLLAGAGGVLGSAGNALANATGMAATAAAAAAGVMGVS